MIAKLLQIEPTALIGFIAAIVGVAVTYGIVSQVKADAWLALLPGLVAVIQAIVTRQTVFAPATVQKIADAATQLAPGTSVDIGSPPNTDASPPPL